MSQTRVDAVATRGVLRPRERRVLGALLVVSSVLLGLGLTGPCMTVLPSLGALDGWVRVFRPSVVQPSEFSIVSGVMRLWQERERSLAVLLCGFSVVFPVMKLAVMGHAYRQVGAVAGRTRKSWALWLAHHGGKFSMLDVLVVAVLVVAIKGLPGGSRIEPGWGLYCFTASVVLAMVSAVWLARLERAAERADGR